jgi:hypothetical protein
MNTAGQRDAFLLGGLVETHSRDGLGIQRCLDVTLGNQAGYQMCRNDTSLRVRREEDSISSTKIVDPSWVR